MLQNAHPVDTRHTRSKLTQVTKSLSLTRRSARWPWRQSSSAWWFVSRWPSCTDCMCVLDWCRHLLWHPFPRIGGEDAQICTMNAHATSLQTLLCCAIIVFPFPTQFGSQGAEMFIYPGAFNTTTGPLHWELLARSRAVDNQVIASLLWLIWTIHCVCTLYHHLHDPLVHQLPALCCLCIAVTQSRLDVSSLGWVVVYEVHWDWIICPDSSQMQKTGCNQLSMALTWVHCLL